MISGIEEIIKRHMENQPFDIRCSECGEELNVYQKKIDSGLDLILDIDPCECCKKEEE